MKFQIIGKNIDVIVINDDVLCRAVVRSYQVGAKVEITIFTKQMTFRTEVRDNDLYAAVDFAIDKLEGQMRKLKTRMDRTKEADSLGKALAFENFEEQDDGDETIVRTKSIYLEPMTIDEAITRMEALGHSFFVYLDDDDNEISVAYKRLDGGYGVIQAENQLK